jgi:hypothetical protein
MQALPVVLSLVFYYKMTDASPRYIPRPRGRDVGSTWALLVIFFVLLKIFAIRTVYSLLGHLNDSVVSSETLTMFTLLPIATVIVDHVAILEQSTTAAWTSLIPSISLNYFLTRYLAVVAGHKIGPAHGRRILGGCLMVTAVCLSIPRLPRKTFTPSLPATC